MNTHYLFGDVDLAAERLFHLARVFEPAMLSFLARSGAPRGGRVLDLGCGPGYTTRALLIALGPRRLVGIDGSERFLARARAESPAVVEYLQGDVTTYDFSTLACDVAYCRFLLSHLPQPSSALARWADALVPGGRLLVQEASGLSSAHPALNRYYELVAALQHRHGQSLHIGRDLPDLARMTATIDAPRFRIISFSDTPLEVSATEMARLHAMNIQTWQHDEGAKQFDPAEIDGLSASLTALSRDHSTSARVSYTMGELVLERV